MIAEEARSHLRILEPKQKASEDGSVVIRVEEEIRFRTEVLDALADGGCRPVHYDLLLLCASVEYADRHWKRTSDWHRYIHVTLPVIELEKWLSDSVQRSLKRALKLLTGDSWSFDFVQANNLNIGKWKQLRLDVRGVKTFAIPYSEGLDSRAVAALCGDHNEALCIRIANKRQEHRHGENVFAEIPFTVKNGTPRESSFRSRGFQFAAMTSIAADIRNIHRIVVPESGQGALGPAMLPLHRLYADYRNHPKYFRLMEKFIEKLLDHQVNFEQPRLWSTKGQTLLAFLQLPNRSEADLVDTRSCWQTRHVVNVGGSRRQCGLCAACLLRRCSLHTAGVTETKGTYVIEDLTTIDVYDAMAKVTDPDDRDNMIEYGIAGTRHFQQMASMANWSDEELRIYVLEIADALGEAETETLTKLRALLFQHAVEWQTFLAAQGNQSFLHNWTGGGNHGRFE
ncbi:MAG: 7-cyano-7-deazaguanine synthase [Candidatus Obscuribacter sp.]|nr:7-cyano-7-deazaguanine synthase [Candidatus Obscuribacter sp.]MBP7575698.1 7-cyano-7-deazaguanine synthase [Candidatus Obscuribacter sp.]